MLHVLIDDIRNIQGMDIICRNASSGIRTCYYFNNISHLYIDHDLGDETRSGYDVIIELLKCGYCPNNVQIVSSNPVGVKNIAAALIDYGYKAALNGIDFKK